MFKKDYLIGLDIGSSSIKLAQFIKKEDGLHLVQADLREIKEEKEVVPALKDLLRGIELKKSKFIVSINCPRTCVRKVTAPRMPGKELAEGIKLEAKNYFPFPIEQAQLDFRIFGDIVEKGIKKYQLLIAASPKKTVDRYISLLNSLDIKPSSFIPAPLALQKVAEHCYFDKDKIIAMLDIGRNWTELAISAGKDLVFSRKIPAAGDDFTKAMTGVLVSDRGRTELSLEEAERIKLEVGIPSEGESGIIEGKISATQVLSMIRPCAEQLVNEIDRCFDYYREETNGGKIDSLRLLGGGAFLKGLPEFLSEGLMMEVKIVDFDGDGGKVSHRLALAMGAGLSEGNGINLLPVEIKEEKKLVFKRATLQSVSAAVILLAVFVYIGMRIQTGNFQKRIDVAKKELLSLQPQFKRLESRSLVNAILSDEPYWGELFKDLSNIIPDNIYLTALNMENKVIKMEGIIVSGEEDVLSDFILTLEEGIFKNVRLVKSKDLEEKAGSIFELRCWVD